MKVGDVIRVIRMDDSNGKDPAVHMMNDVISVITHIDVNGNQKCSDFGNSECSIFGIKTTVLLASAVQ